MSGFWQLASGSPPPNTATRLVVKGPRANGSLEIERDYSTGVVLERYRVDAPPIASELEARRAGDTLVLDIPGVQSRGAAPSLPNREETWSIGASGELIIDVADRFGNAPAARSRLTFTRRIASAKPGENLVANGDASRGRAHWSFVGKGSVDVRDGNPCFVLSNLSLVLQTVLLPENAPGQYLVAIGAGANQRIGPSITGKANLYGILAPADGSKYLGYMQGQQMLADSPEPNRWVKMSGIYPVPPSTAYVGFRLGQGSARGVEPDGSKSCFDDVGLYLFPTEADARSFVGQWKGRSR
ncbi:MAG TPA: hypothetical protein VFV98_18255 [Vicinamibacterales bacterium]|nr:hypothetical protein [Vicinamibacterales bacterium]